MFDYQCKLLRVVDGDTIDVNIDLGFSVWHKARVRMLGIDTVAVDIASDTIVHSLTDSLIGRSIVVK